MHRTCSSRKESRDDTPTSAEARRYARRNLSANTQRAYLQQVGTFAKHFGRSLATLGPEEIRAWQLHLVEVRQLARSSKVTETAALPFPDAVTLERDWAVDDIVMSKKPRTLPVILSRDEATIFLESIRSFRQRAILMGAYAGSMHFRSDATEG
jgi:integrase/recombinase XerD